MNPFVKADSFCEKDKHTLNRSLIALPYKLGSMCIINPTEMANEEYINSSKLTEKFNKNTGTQYQKMK